MEANKEAVRFNSLQNQVWAIMMNDLPNIQRIADCEAEDIENLNFDDRHLVISVFCFVTSMLFKKRAETAELEDQFGRPV